MKEHIRMYNECKKAVKEIVCEGCIVRATCNEYCEGIDYLMIMCADTRHHDRTVERKAELLSMARDVKENKIQLERSNESNFGI